MSGSIPNCDIESYSGFRLRKRYMEEKEIHKHMITLDFVPCHEIPVHCQQSIYIKVKKPNEWVTISIVERRIFSEANDMLILRLTNLRSSYLDVFLLGKPLKKYKDLIKVGTVLGITQPKVLHSENHIGMQVDHLYQLWHIGESKDMGRCEAYSKDDKQCPSTIDRRSGEYCDIHMARICNLSKNNRMELAGGDAGIDVRWTNTRLSQHGQTFYQGVSCGTYVKDKSKRKEHTYTVQGKRITSDGKELNKKPVVDEEKEAKNKEAWIKYLKGQNDPGAVNIRKVIGIKEEAKSHAGLSKEALLQIHNETRLEPEQKESKKRSIEQILAMDRHKRNKQKQEKKPLYIDL